MWSNHLLLAFLAVCAGVGVSTGTVAFLMVIGVIQRFLRRAKMSGKVILGENTVVLGILLGNFCSLFVGSFWTDAAMESVQRGWVTGVLLQLILLLYGLGSGIFIGCVAASLAEIINTFPILFRRFHIKEGLPWIILCMALGKTAGALFYFFGGYAIIP